MVDASRYDVLLLDFGGVCLLNPVELHDTATTRLGLPQGSFSWLGPIDPSTDELWQHMVAGEGLTERDYWAMRAREVGEAAGRDLDTRAYMTLLYEPPAPELVRPEAISTVEAAIAADRRRSRLDMIRIARGARVGPKPDLIAGQLQDLTADARPFLHGQLNGLGRSLLKNDRRLPRHPSIR